MALSASASDIAASAVGTADSAGAIAGRRGIVDAGPEEGDEDKDKHEDLQWQDAGLLGVRTMEILLTRLAIFEICAYIAGFITFWTAAYYVTRAAVRDGMLDAMPRRPIDRPAWADTQDMRAER